jgi:hypothetical protein
VSLEGLLWIASHASVMQLLRKSPKCLRAELNYFSPQLNTAAETCTLSSFPSRAPPQVGRVGEEKRGGAGRGGSGRAEIKIAAALKGNMLNHVNCSNIL